MKRVIVFTLAATSIWCLLGQMYGLWPMGWFALAVFVPSFCVLMLLALHDRWRGDGRLYRGVMIGLAGGLLATVAYDLFRVPFVYAGLPLFKVFPMFGAMILGTSDTGLPAAHAVGWAYHFSNGATFGVMYVTMVGEELRRRWPMAVVFAVGLELAMLFTTYPATFGIRVGAAFVAVTLAAHLIFGVTLGLTGRGLALRMSRC
jgi:hypothetical protein